VYRGRRRHVDLVPSQVTLKGASFEGTAPPADGVSQRQGGEQRRTEVAPPIEHVDIARSADRLAFDKGARRAGGHARAVAAYRPATLPQAAQRRAGGGGLDRAAAWR